MGPWFAEWYYLGDGQLLDEMIKNRERIYNQLTPIEADIPIHERLVIVQAESLDTNILGYRVNGVEVTPFLNQLRRQSMSYRVKAMHWRGSSDADFAALNGVPGSRRANSYSVSNYPYANTTPQLLARCGYEVVSFHGNVGDFYQRRGAYEKMGFSDIYFREELEGRIGLPAGRWGVYDQEVLRFSAQQLRDAAKPTCHFVITLTTHTPYNQLPPGAHEIYPEPTTTAERYINNMRYLDNCLRDYITALGNGTTVVIYADHPTEDFAQFKCDRDLGRELEYVPCLIYDSDQDLAKLQKTRRNPISTDGTLNLLDVINYVRGQVQRTCEKTTPAA
jgi:phosphoglycerol transferase MdoB-like AlkP superfamily enzyme